jgi:uncharacterized protein (TIGR02271 family)
LERYALPAEPPRDLRPEKPVAQGERTREEKVIPVVEEQIGVERRKVSTGKVLIHKRVDAEDILVDEPVLHERYDIERVPVNRLIEQPVEPYYEGDTFVLPVLEEVVTVEKKLILREEVRVTRRRDTGRDPQNVSVRRERVEFERVPES